MAPVEGEIFLVALVDS
jgi:hypothetical protein